MAPHEAPHSRIDKLGLLAGGGGVGSEADRATQGSSVGKESLKPLIENTRGVGAATGETPSLTGEVVGQTHRGVGRAQAHPLGNQHQRGPV